jgi:transposase
VLKDRTQASTTRTAKERRLELIFVGDDWSEQHHDVCVLDEKGRVLARRQLPEGVAGVAGFHELVGGFVDSPDEVAIAIETDRGLWVAALVGAGYQVYGLNPKSVARYKERYVLSGAKSDPADAKVLADLARTDRHNYRQVAGDSPEAQGLKVLARAHQRLVWLRRRQLNALRATLREFYPAALVAFGEDLADRDAVAVLGRAPTPEAGRSLTQAAAEAALRRAGRQRNVKRRAEEIREALRSEQLAPPEGAVSAYGAVARSAMAVVAEMNRQLEAMEAELASHLDRHPDAEVIYSQPGLATVLGARVLGEFGDDPDRYVDARARKNYAGTSPITVSSGKRTPGKRGTVKARWVGNDHLRDACQLWAFSALSASPGARAYYDALRARKIAHDAALRVLANRLVGILDCCLRRHVLYDEEAAWAHWKAAA